MALLWFSFQITADTFLSQKFLDFPVVDKIPTLTDSFVVRLIATPSSHSVKPHHKNTELLNIHIGRTWVHAQCWLKIFLTETLTNIFLSKWNLCHIQHVSRQRKQKHAGCLPSLTRTLSFSFGQIFFQLATRRASDRHPCQCTMIMITMRTMMMINHWLCQWWRESWWLQDGWYLTTLR